MFYTDQHVHSFFSGDGEASAEAQIEKAISLGMKRICFTDHHDHDVVSDVDFTLDFPRYFEEMKRLREKYSGVIEICAGVEMGLQTHIADYLNALAKEYPFDVMIGSVHFVDGIDPYLQEYYNAYPNNAYERYFETVLECINAMNCYDVLGHLDYVVRYGAQRGLAYSYKMYADIIDEILRKIIAENKALECNTGGLSRGLAEPNPCRDIFVRYRELGGELVTLGSDAHSPETLGYEFKKCGELLKECGFRYYAVYRNRIPELKLL